MKRVRNSIAGLLVAGMTVALAACGGSASKSVLDIGVKAPPVHTTTLADVGGDLSRITTYRYPDKEMYQYSLHEALKADKPILLEFATPAHCTVCDKQLQMLKALRDKYGDDVIFLHMDQYQNPQAYKAFRVIGDPWTFVIDRNQVVKYRQSGRMLYGELDRQIQKVLREPASSSSKAG